MSDFLRALIIGCGSIAGGYQKSVDDDEILTHAGAYTHHPAFDLHACIDPDEETRLAFMARWNIDNGFSDLASARRANLKFDVASIANPTHAHADTLNELLVHHEPRLVFCEKPITADANSARDLVKQYETANIPLAVNYVRRWDPSIVELQNRFRGKSNQVQSITAWYTKGLLNNASHIVDLLHFLVGSLEPVAVLNRRNGFSDADPTLDVQLRTSAGAPVYLIGADQRYFTIWEVEILTKDACIRLSDSGFQMRSRVAGPSRRYDGYTVLDREETVATELARAMYFAADNINQTILNGAELSSSGRSALATHELCGRILEMAE